MSDPRAFIVVITAAVLLYAAITDLQEFRIRNELILCLIMLWLVHVAADHEWTSLYRDIGFAALLFIFMLYFYARSWMGGGDVKLATVPFLWTGADRAGVRDPVTRIRGYSHRSRQAWMGGGQAYAQQFGAHSLCTVNRGGSNRRVRSRMAARNNVVSFKAGRSQEASTVPEALGLDDGQQRDLHTKRSDRCDLLSDGPVISCLGHRCTSVDAL
jgi:hypothetical protein